MENETEVSTEPVADSDLERVTKQIAGGDNVNAEKSLDQLLQMKKDSALERRKLELAAAMFAKQAEPEEVGASAEEE
jgi:hypothetical protein